MIKKIVIEHQGQAKQVILVGTAHISRESIDLVNKTIEEEQPDVIGIELDKPRLEQLLSKKKWQETNLVEIIKTGKTYLFLLNIFLSNMQRQIGKQIGIEPGSEMIAALKKAQEKKIPIQLLDRDVSITLKKAFNEMSLKEKVVLGGSFVAGFFGEAGEKVTVEKIEELKKEDLINNLMKELGKQFPSIKKVLVDERDLYISEMIKHSPGKKIVAVVGAGHIEGIVNQLHSNKRVDLNKLNIVPKKKSFFKHIALALPLLFVIILAYTLFTKGFELTLSVLFYWILIVGSCSGVGALLARAHPLAILTAFFSAPLTTLHPALAAGWFSGFVETKYNSPRVKDFESLPELGSVTQFYNNKVTHILIVASLTNLGAMVGVLVAFPAIIALIA